MLPAWRRVDLGGSGVDNTDPTGVPVSGSVADRIAPLAGPEDPPVTAAFVIGRRGPGFAESMRNPAPLVVRTDPDRPGTLTECTTAVAARRLAPWRWVPVQQQAGGSSSGSRRRSGCRIGLMRLGILRRSGCRWPGAPSDGGPDGNSCLIVLEILKGPRFATVETGERALDLAFDLTSE